MSVVTDVRTALNEALRAVEGVRVYDDPGANMDPPALLVGPPTLTWEGYGSGPVNARIIVYLVVPENDRVLEKLGELITSVADAIDDTENAVVVRADPGTFIAGSQELPSYEVLVEVAL
jgi:hypothetical protein